MRFKGGIRAKTAFFVSLITFVVVGIGVILGYFWGAELLRDAIGEQYSQIAFRAGYSVADILKAKVDAIETYLTAPVIATAINAADLRYKNMPADEIIKSFLDMDKKWVLAQKDSSLANGYLNSPAGIRLNEIVKYDDNIGEMFITDKFGGLVASSDKTSDFYQADEDWWQETYYGGKGRVWLEDIEYDESSKTWGAPLGIPIKGDEGELNGICKTMLDTDNLFAPLHRIHFGETGCAILLNEKGDILSYEGVTPYTDKLLDAVQIEKMLNSKKMWKIGAGLLKNHPGTRLMTLREIDLSFIGKSNTKWIIAISVDPGEVYAPIRKLSWQMLIFFVVLIIVLLPLGLLFGNTFVKPITKLHSAVERIIAGDMECGIDIKTGDEIEWLSESFITMVRKVKEEQKKLLHEKLYSQGIVASMADALLVINPDTTLKLVNKSTLDLLGYKEDELIGQPFKKIFMQEEEEEEEEEEEGMLYKYFQKIIDGGVAYNIGLTFLTRQGETIPINFSGALMRQDDKIIGIVGVARDVRQTMAIIGDLENKGRELKERGEELTRMQKALLHIMGDLQETSRVKAQFTGMVSHELRTPLSVIKEGISVVLDKIVGSINEEQEKYLDIAKKNVDRLDRLIGAVLDFQTLESGKIEFKMEEDDINGAVKEIRQVMLPVAEKKNLSFTCQLEENLPRIRFDHDKIIQVLTNLANNAIKFTEKGGITITTSKGDNVIRVTVKDTGPGIKKEDMPKLFQQFVQLQRKMGGTGLGLSICKQIIEAHKGKIWAESEFGKGSSFNFIIPIKERRV